MAMYESIVSISHKRANYLPQLYRDYIDDRNATSEETLYTASNGVPIPHPYETQRVGENGPLLLQE